MTPLVFCYIKAVYMYMHFDSHMMVMGSANKQQLFLAESHSSLSLIGRKFELTKIGNMQITIGEEAIPSTSVARNIGVMFYTTM